MAFNWLDYLDFFHYLEDTNKLKNTTNKPVPNNLDEAISRAMVSRAYYSVFNYSLNHAKNNLKYDELEPIYNQFIGVRSDKKANSHNLIRDIFDYYHNQNALIGYGAISGMLNTLRNHRNNCDYNDNQLNLINYITNSRDVTKIIITKINNIEANNLILIQKFAANTKLQEHFRAFLKN